MTQRRALHVFAATFVATLALNACGREAPANPPPGSAEPGAIPAEPGPAAPAAPSAGTWTVMGGEQGNALLLTDTTGNGVLQLACLKDGKRMVVRATMIERIGSEERLSFGIDEEPMVFVVDLESPAVGIEASSAIAPDFVARLKTARSVSLSYGAQTFGPVAAPEPAKAASFEAGCRQIAGG